MHFCEHFAQLKVLPLHRTHAHTHIVSLTHTHTLTRSHPLRIADILFLLLPLLTAATRRLLRHLSCVRCGNSDAGSNDACFYLLSAAVALSPPLLSMLLPPHLPHSSSSCLAIVTSSSFISFCFVLFSSPAAFILLLLLPLLLSAIFAANFLPSPLPLPSQPLLVSLCCCCFFFVTFPWPQIRVPRAACCLCRSLSLRRAAFALLAVCNFLAFSPCSRAVRSLCVCVPLPVSLTMCALSKVRAADFALFAMPPLSPAHFFFSLWAKISF